LLSISIRNLSKSYGEKILFEDFSIDISSQDKIGIIGANGAGKSTLLKIIIQELEPDKGYVRLFGKVGYLPQEISLPQESLVREYFKLRRYKGFTEFRKDLFDAKWGSLSGGEKTKLKLLEVLTSGPSVLILDEPTNHLDIKSIEELESILQRFKGPVLLVSHDRFFLDRVTNKTIEIFRGKISVYPGNYTYYAEQKRIELERAWEDYEKYVSKRRQLEEASRERLNRAQSVSKIKDKRDSFWRYSKDFYARKGAKIAKSAKALEKRIEKMETKEKPYEEQNIRFSFGSSQDTGNILVYGENVRKAFGDNILFIDASFSIKRNDKIILLGANGTGKTTLLRMILRKEPLSQGNIWVSSQVRIGYLDQEILLLDPNKTVLEEVRGATIGDITTIRTFLGCLLFSEDAVLKKISNLSTGEKVRVTLAKLILGDYNLLIMDEPTNFLDIKSREVIERALKDYNGSLLFVSHDRYFISRLANTVWEIEDNALKCYPGDYDYYLYKREYDRDNVKDKILLLEVQLANLLAKLDAVNDEKEKIRLNTQSIELKRELNRLKKE